jgi:hypothetical protein
MFVFCGASIMKNRVTIIALLLTVIQSISYASGSESLDVMFAQSPEIVATGLLEDLHDSRKAVIAHAEDAQATTGRIQHIAQKVSALSQQVIYPVLRYLPQNRYGLPQDYSAMVIAALNLRQRGLAAWFGISASLFSDPNAPFISPTDEDTLELHDLLEEPLLELCDSFKSGPPLLSNSPVNLEEIAAIMQLELLRQYRKDTSPEDPEVTMLRLWSCSEQITNFLFFTAYNSARQQATEEPELLGRLRESALSSLLIFEQHCLPTCLPNLSIAVCQQRLDVEIQKFASYLKKDQAKNIRRDS